MLRANPATTQGALFRRRILEKIHLLCSCGVGIEAIASPLCAALRDLLQADSGSLFWLDDHGAPSGFFHDCAPAEIKDIFITRFDELFALPSEPNMISILTATGPSIGVMITQEQNERLWASNVYKYLCAPLGHRYLLDMRCDVDGAGRVLFCAWNCEDRAFTQHHAELLVPAQKLIEMALASPQQESKWHSLGARTAHFITDISGSRLTAIEADAEKMLMAGHLLRQNVSMTQPVDAPPSFALQLAAMLASDAHATIRIPVPDGRIVAEAVRTSVRSPGAAPSENMFVSLDLEVCRDALMIEHVSDLPLTLLQKEIMLFAMRGGERSESEQQFGVGPEALKKHLRAIYDASGCAKWLDLAAIDIAAHWPRSHDRPCARGLF